MTFILTGFKQDAGFRVFAFEGIASDKSRVNFTVRADLALSRRFGIRMQELPLLCRGLLDQIGEAAKDHAITFSEERMKQHADRCAALLEAAQAKRARRAPPVNTYGGGWRTQQI
jgi:hypothetical protein